MASEDLLDLADWTQRSVEFRSLRAYEGWCSVAAMEYEPADLGATEEWVRLRTLWLDLHQHPHVVDAVDEENRTLLLRYTALHWKHPGVRLHVEAGRTMVAKWAVQLVDAFQTILDDVSESEMGHFLRPVVRIDLGHAARVCFLPVVAEETATLAPDWPRCGEQAIAYVIGEALRERCADLDSTNAAEVKAIIERCSRPTEANHYRSLSELRRAWEAAGGKGAVRAGEKQASWTLAEDALGWVAVGRSTKAMDMFEEALELDLHSRVAQQGLRRASELMGVVSGTLVPGQSHRWTPSAGAAEQRFSWSEVAEKARQLESVRAFDGALALYVAVRMDGTNDAAIYTAIARCYLALRAGANAVDYAQRALAVQSKLVEAHAIRARAYLLMHKHEDALKCTRHWLAVDQDDAVAHYTRGRALLALRQYLDARDAFDRACALRPGMIEAMLLRREADRAATLVREEVGRQPEIKVDLPEHLAELRDALSHGRIDEVISVLERPDHDADGAAKLVHAQCLAFMEHFAEAVEMFDRSMALSSEHERAATRGKAHALLAMDEAAQALTCFDHLLSRDPGDLESIEGRAQALRQLGRDAEAEDALRSVVAASGGRAQLRVDSVRR